MEALYLHIRIRTLSLFYFHKRRNLHVLEYSLLNQNQIRGILKRETN